MPFDRDSQHNPLSNLVDALEEESPVPFLYLASSFASGTPLDSYLAVEQGGLELSLLIEKMLRNPHPVTDALLLAWAELLANDELTAKVDATVRPRVEVVPAWLADIKRIRPQRAVVLRAALGEQESIAVEVSGPRGVVTLVCGFDMLGEPSMDDAYPVPEKIEEMLARIPELDLPTIEITEVSLADARARIEEAYGETQGLYPPLTTDTWPSSGPLLMWVLRMLPAGGVGFGASKWTDAQRNEIVSGFLSSPFGMRIPAGARDLVAELLELAVIHGTGNPLELSPMLVDYLLCELIPGTGLALGPAAADVPEVMMQLVRFAHERLGIDAELTAETLQVIDDCQDEYLWNVEGGPDEFTLELPFGPDFVAHFVRRDRIDHLDTDPLPADESLDLDGVPEEIRSRVRDVGAVVEDTAQRFFVDPEMRTAALRTVAYIGTRAPQAFRGRTKDVNLAAAICWMVGHNNGWFSQAGAGRSVADMLRWMGVKTNPRSRAERITQQLHLPVEFPSRYSNVSLGEPELLVSSYRENLLASLAGPVELGTIRQKGQS